MGKEKSGETSRGLFEGEREARIEKGDVADEGDICRAFIVYINGICLFSCKTEKEAGSAKTNCPSP